MTIRSTWRMYREASRTKRNFDTPARVAYSMGTYRMGCWLDRKASVIVVTQEKPGGNRRREGSATSRRNTRSRELRAGIREVVRFSAIFRVVHLAGIRSALVLP